MEQIKNLITSCEIPIKQAWRQLNDNGHKILFVVNEEGVLLGSVTDGDIRRWILEDQPITSAIEKVMCGNPIVAKQNESKERIKEKMLETRIDCIPIIDDRCRVVEVFFWDDFFKNGESRKKYEKLDIPVVIMAGGRGVRLEPFTKILPKPLIPIGDKPVIEVIMEKFNRFGIRDFFLSLNYKANMIKAYFQDCSYDYNIRYCEETEPSGTVGSVALLADHIHSTFIVSNADIIIEANYAEIVQFHKDKENLITLVCSMKHFPIPYGVVEIANGGLLKSIEEKPEFDRLVLTGLYVVEPQLIRMIPKGQVFHMTHLIEKLRLEEKRIGVYPVSERDWMDIGELEAYRETLERFK